MTPTSELVVGGVRWSCDAGHGRLVERDPNYRGFFFSAQQGDQQPPADLVVPVSITLDPAPAPSSDSRVFDTGATWKAYAHGEERWLVLPAAGTSSYLWAARLSFDPPAVEVHCGPRLVEDGGEPPTIANPMHYPLDQLLCAFVLPAQRGVVLHGAGLEREGRAVACVGVSGAGKTTISRLAQGRRGVECLSDDRLVLRERAERFRVHGTPWAGEAQIAVNRDAELIAMVALEKADANELRRLETAAALSRLLPISSILWFDEQRSRQSLALLESLLRQVPCYELRFRPQEEAVDLLLELL